MTQRTFVSGLVVLLFCFATGAEEVTTLPSAAATVEEVLDTSGIDAANARFRELLDARDSFDFDGNAFVALGRRLQQSGELAEAEAVYRMTLEAFPEVTWLHRRIAAVRFAAGDESGSLESMATMNRLDDQESLETYLAGDHPPLAQNAAEVIQRHLAATGGAEAWRTVRTMEVTVGGFDSRGRTIRIVRQYKRPLKYRQQVVGSESFRATDGERVWRVDDEGWHETVDSGFTTMASVDGWFLDPEQNGIGYEMLGFEFFYDAPVYRLRRTFANGRQEDLFFSAEQGYLTEIYSEYPVDGPVMTSYASLWDYREAGKVKIPHVFIRNVGALGPPHGIVIEKVV
ncbi:MAG: hypothetical protein MUP13_11635, partial [Thermoanaerobaculales bacterium]|nr:hypothetical protein [Thermoanaerobaculales bacterium]